MTSRSPTLCGLPVAVAVSLPVPSLLLPAGCASDDGSVNVLPTPSTSTSTGTNGDGSSDVGATDGQLEFPQVYRFDCVDIQELGDADGSVLQAKVLENTWASDIESYKLSILLEVMERDEAAGTATIGIRSGRGTGPEDLCNEPSSVTDPYMVGHDPNVGLWEPTSETSMCSVMSAGSAPRGGSYIIDLGPQSLIYVYAEDDDGTRFNCTPDQSVPDAVPIRAVQAEVTADETGSSIAGVLTGCLLESEAMSLCSCLGACAAEGPDDVQVDGQCAGCPKGGSPLRDLLGGINNSQRCTDLMEATAFDLRVAFTAVALPSIPPTCG